MVTWAVGDIHGCFETVERLMARLDFDQRSDRLWLTGDLVNRGPRSLEVLRWAREREGSLGSRFVTVLGNHDLHLIAVARGIAVLRQKDRLDELLAAGDGKRLIAWLEARPLLHHEDRWLLVHAGLHPSWTLEEAKKLARRVERGLREPSRAGELLLRAGHGADVEDPDWRALATLTRMRTLTAKGRFGKHNGLLVDIPDDEWPWFKAPGRRPTELTVVAGHWGGLGLYLGRDVVALDTGAGWRGPLTAIRLEDRHVVQEPNRDMA